MEVYCESLREYRRLKTLEARVGDLAIGNFHPVRVQTMTTTDTMDTAATVGQTIRCIDAGAELVRITAPSKREAENLLAIKKELHRRGYFVPLVADIHFTPNAAEIAARIVEKVRINPGNYIDKKKFEFIDYTDAEYREEVERIRQRFMPLVKICKEYGTAMRIGTNHGSLSDRIMSRYGDTPMGMVESAMEFLRVARDESFHNIILSMKSSNPLVMVEAYRLLISRMFEEFDACYPLHLGVTEAGDGEDGRIKSAIGIGTLMEDGIGDTIRVSLTEDPELEIPVCRDLVARYVEREKNSARNHVSQEPKSETPVAKLPYSPFSYRRRPTIPVDLIGDGHVPVVVADFSGADTLEPADLESIGYRYESFTDKWHIGDTAADFIYTGEKIPGFALPGTLRMICDYTIWTAAPRAENLFPLLTAREYIDAKDSKANLHFIDLDTSDEKESAELRKFMNKKNDVVLVLRSPSKNPVAEMRQFVARLMEEGIDCPLVISVHSSEKSVEETLIRFSVETGAVFLEGMGDGIWLTNEPSLMNSARVSGRTYLESTNNHQFINNTSFSILQATRTRISKTEYISCPSCGRTLFDLQETTARIRTVTSHLKGVKIAIMGCIVNGPGEMADADFGYVGSGVGKITLYRGKDIVKRNVESVVAVEELVNLLKESGAWTEPVIQEPALSA